MDVTLFIQNLVQNIALSTYFAVFVVIISSLLFIKTKFRCRSHLNFAPRATGGHVLFGHITDMLNKPHILLESLREKHGNIFSIGFGGKYTVVLTDWESVKEYLKMEGASLKPSELVTISDDFDHVFEINGKPWEARRKFAINAIRGLNLSRSTEDLITSEVSRVLNSVDEMDLSQDTDFRKLLATATNNVGMSTICGKAYGSEHPMSNFILDYNLAICNSTKLRPIAKSLGFPPSIFTLVSSTFKKSVRDIDKMADFIRSEIESHTETLDDQNPRDLIDYALIEMAKSNETKSFKKTSEIVGDALLLILASTDTVRVASEWAFLLLAEYQDMQDRILKEILQVYGDRKPTWDQHTSLPFTEAFIVESQRWKTMVPVLTPRKAPRDIKIQGYDVPKGSYVLNSLQCVHMDEQVYPDPKKFDPTRFLSVDGTKVVLPEYFIPFSYGNRNCLGDKIGKMELFLILTGMLQKFRILPPKGGVSFEDKFVVELYPVHPFVKLQKRF